MEDGPNLILPRQPWKLGIPFVSRLAGTDVPEY